MFQFFQWFLYNSRMVGIYIDIPGLKHMIRYYIFEDIIFIVFSLFLNSRSLLVVRKKNPDEYFGLQDQAGNNLNDR